MLNSIVQGGQNLMTIEELMNKIDGIDIDSRDDCRYTEQELYEIGSNFIQLTNSEKRAFGGWDKLVEILQPLDRNGEPMKKGDTFRQWIKSRRYKNEEMIHNDHMLSGQNINDISFAEFEEKTEKLKQDLYKQEVKTRDERNSYRRTLRDEARIEKMKSLISDSIAGLKNLEDITYEGNPDESVEAVMLLSDMHVGMQINNFANFYNVTVARKRMMAYVDETIRICQESGVQRLNVCNLGDMIHGLIHITARLEEEEEFVEQIMIAAEIIAEALNKLQEAAPEVIYRSVTDNHGRVIANYKEHIEKENITRLIDFYVKPRLKDTNVIFAEDNLDWDISMFDLLNGKTMICSHGHRDNINTILQGYAGAVRKYVDYVCVGHYHASKMKSFQGAKVFVNGSLCGVDSYAQSRRLFDDPEQTLLVFRGDTLSQHLINLANVK